MNGGYITINENREFGRYAVLAKAVQPGEILFEEYPFVMGPKPNSPPICLGCCCEVDGSVAGPRCKKCKWPLCENCAETVADAHIEECKVFSGNNVKFLGAATGQPCLQLEFITPLRYYLFFIVFGFKLH